MGDQDVFRALRGAASAALSNDSSRGGEKRRGEERKGYDYWVELEQ